MYPYPAIHYVLNQFLMFINFITVAYLHEDIVLPTVFVNVAWYVPKKQKVACIAKQLIENFRYLLVCEV